MPDEPFFELPPAEGQGETQKEGICSVAKTALWAPRAVVAKCGPIRAAAWVVTCHGTGYPSIDSRSWEVGVKTFRCRRCGKRVSRERNLGVKDEPVILPGGEPQETLLKGMNLLHQPMGRKVLRVIRGAYRGTGCRYHPAQWVHGESWGGETVEVYGCCWAFAKDMPGCRIGPHIDREENGRSARSPSDRLFDTVAREPAAKRKAYCVLEEDPYETLFGDGLDLEFKEAFFDEDVAWNYIRRKVLEKNAYVYRIREVWIDASGKALRVPDLENEENGDLSDKKVLDSLSKDVARRIPPTRH